MDSHHFKKEYNVLDLTVKGLWVNHCYVVYDPDSLHALLIDPAWQPEIIQNAIDINKLQPKIILITHGHMDHIDLADYFAIKYGIPIICHTEEAKLYNLQFHNLFCLNKEEMIEIGTLEIKPLLTPGHTVGGISYLLGSNLFSGDTLFLESCGVCIDTGSCPKHLYHSLQKIKQLPPSTKLYPGHQYQYAVGNDLAFAYERNLYLQIDNIEDFVKIRQQQNKFAKVPVTL